MIPKRHTRGEGVAGKAAMHRRVVTKSLLLATALAALFLSSAALHAGDYSVKSPDGRITCSISDTQGLHYSVQVDGKAVLASSQLGMEFKDGTKLGSTATIAKASPKSHTGTWENRFGHRRLAADNWKELDIELTVQGSHTFGFIVRAFNNGVAFRVESGYLSLDHCPHKPA